MPFIGNKPSAVPLTSADITDGIIVNADISSTAGITLNKLSGNPNFRNIVINGDMQIAQRATSVASISGTSDTYPTLDRFHLQVNSLGTWTNSQSTDVPSGYGFANSLKMDCTAADASPAASDFLVIRQIFEGQNLQYLKKGTANASPLTLSFWVKSTKTGTFIAELYDTDNTRQVSKSYTVNASNTWEFKTITYPADTTGTFTNDNGSSLQLNFWLGAGSNFTSGTLQTSWATSVTANRAVGQVNIADSTANDWLITGVQLEAGTSASDFEFLPYDVSLGRCRRYYFKNLAEQNMPLASGVTNGTTNARYTLNFPSTMRASPTLSVSSASGFKVYCGTTNVTTTSIAFYYANTLNALIYADVASGLTNGQGTIFLANGTSDFIEGNSEL